jgi:hypothetical protein
MIKAILAASLLVGTGVGVLKWQTSPARRDLAEAQAALERRWPIYPTTTPSEDLDEADGAESTWIGDIDGDGRRDLMVKRYWTGSGAGYELMVCLSRADGTLYYHFSGSERGTDYWPIAAHIGGINTIVVPTCFVDRGADTTLNTVSVYVLRGGVFVPTRK